MLVATTLPIEEEEHGNVYVVGVEPILAISCIECSWTRNANHAPEVFNLLDMALNRIIQQEVLEGSKNTREVATRLFETMTKGLDAHEEKRNGE